MTYGLLLWKLPNAQDSYVHPDEQPSIAYRESQRFASLKSWLKALAS